MHFRHCGYIKAKQDPDEEKMQFQNGRGKVAKIACTQTHKTLIHNGLSKQMVVFRGNINVKGLSSRIESGI